VAVNVTGSAALSGLGPPPGVAAAESVSPRSGAGGLAAREWSGDVAALGSAGGRGGCSIGAVLARQRGGGHYSRRTARRGAENRSVAVESSVASAKSPKTYDVTIKGDFAENGKTYQGIYEVDGDTLRTCVQLDAKKDRPTEFVSKPGSGLQVVVWKHVKP
jgi:hypothetical protein